MTKMELLKKLREITQAGIVDCNKALAESNNNLDEAVEWLRAKGIAKAAKKADAVAAEGITVVDVKGDKAVILELNCQTDFVAQNKDFIALANEIKDIVMNHDYKTVEEVLNAKLASGKTVQTTCDEMTGKIGEKITLRRFEKRVKSGNEDFGIYLHANNRVATLIKFDNKPKDADTGKNVAMHAAAMAPKFLSKNHVDQKWLETEINILKEQTIAEGKPAEFAEKIVQGRKGKLLAQHCLEDQDYVKEPGITVATYTKNNGSKMIDYVRFEVGEGIEKVESDFAAEVAEQMKAK